MAQGAAATAAVGSAQAHDASAFAANWPRCVRCGGIARPAILMFGDHSYVEDEAAFDRYNLWRQAVLELAPMHAYRVVVLEVGCGGNVTTVRQQSEEMVRELSGVGVDATLVRVNPELPLADDASLSPRVIPILSRGLAAVRAIDERLEEIRAAAGGARGFSDAVSESGRVFGTAAWGTALEEYEPIAPPLPHERAELEEEEEEEEEAEAEEEEERMEVEALAVDGDVGADSWAAGRSPLRAAADADAAILEAQLKQLQKARDTIKSADHLLAAVEGESAWERFAAYPAVMKAREAAAAAKPADAAAAQASAANELMAAPPHAPMSEDVD